MSISAFAGKIAPQSILLDISKLISAYYNNSPDMSVPEQIVAFGTSGHRGCPFNSSFTEKHVLSITQAVCEYRQGQGITGPLFMGMDTHGLSFPAQQTAIEVFAANRINTFIHAQNQVTPTPVISFSILEYNRANKGNKADGVVITPSHNPPEDGGFKYNPPHGGPADTEITAWIEKRANELIRSGLKEVKRIPYAKAVKSEYIHEYDYITPYVEALPQVVDIKVIAASGLKLGADALGGSSFPFWEAVAKKYALNLDVLNAVNDPRFSFMTVDKDGKIRMDCSSPWAMAGLIEHSSKYDLAFGNDPDADRHGIVTPGGLMNPNHYLAVAANYLFSHRPKWNKNLSLGKTVVTSAMLDKVAASLGRDLYEVPVGFKWFVTPLLEAQCAFGCEESAGASFLRFNSKTWSTDKDGLIMNLLAAEMTAVTSQSPDKLYNELTKKFGNCYYERQDAPANAMQKKILKNLSAEDVKDAFLAGDPISAVFTSAPGNGAAVGGLKVATANGWFAARPSGTEDVYKIYAESLVGEEHLNILKTEAKALVDKAFKAFE